MLPIERRQVDHPMLQIYEKLIHDSVGWRHPEGNTVPSASFNQRPTHFASAGTGAGFAGATGFAAAALAFASASALAFVSAFAFSAASRPSTSEAFVG